MGVIQETHIDLVLIEVLYVPRLQESLLSLRSIEKGGLEFLGYEGMLAIGHGRIRLVPEGSLYACQAYHMPTSFPTRVIKYSMSEDVTARAVIAPGKPHSRGIDSNISHASHSHDHERLLKATAQ